MQYIDVMWLHQDRHDPYRLVSELDGQRYETRKLEFFRSGNVGYASLRASVNGTELGQMPVPQLESINEDPQFSGGAIERSEFEALWQLHAGPDA